MRSSIVALTVFCRRIVQLKKVLKYFFECDFGRIELDFDRFEALVGVTERAQALRGSASAEGRDGGRFVLRVEVPEVAA